MQSVINEVKTIALQYPAVYKVVLFGSRARGDWRIASDFDFAIFANFCSVAEQALFNVAVDAIDTLHKIDVTFISGAESESFLQQIEREGVLVMERFAIKRENFQQALARLNEAVTVWRKDNSGIIRDGLIQRFEFTTELAWKTVREYLIAEGFVELNSPKAVMKQAFASGIVEDQLVWINILNDRNTTSHIYQESTAIEISERIVNSYCREFEQLLAKLL